jgi:hypothetical protein
MVTPELKLVIFELILLFNVGGNPVYIFFDVETKIDKL